MTMLSRADEKDAEAVRHCLEIAMILGVYMTNELIAEATGVSEVAVERVIHYLIKSGFCYEAGRNRIGKPYFRKNRWGRTRENIHLILDWWGK